MIRVIINKRILTGIVAIALLLRISLLFIGSSSQSQLIKDDNNKINNLNIEGLSLMDEGKYEDAKDHFLEALKYAESDTSSERNELLSTTYNNLCYAYYWIEDYNLSLDYGEKALTIGRNDFKEYTNYGNVLYSLNRTDEAIKYYNMAINENEDALYAYNGKGKIYYDSGNYDLAYEMFDKYLKFDPEDLETNIYMVYCNTYLGDNEKALNLVNQLIEDNNDNLELYDAKGEVLFQSNGYDEANNFYSETANIFLNNIDAQIMYASFLFDNEVYDQALNLFLSISKDFSSNGEVDESIIYCYGALEDFEGALAYYNESSENGKASYELNTAMGDYYYNETMYMEAIGYFDKAILLEPEIEEGYINKIYSLYYGKRYSRSLEAALDALEKFPSSYEISMLIGESYFLLCEYENAIVYYKQAIDLKSDDIILSYLGEAYLMLEDYENAGKYAEQALVINSDNTTAQGIKDTITTRQEPFNEQLKEFIKANYLYYDVDGDDQKIEELFNDTNITNLGIAQSIEEFKQMDDIFTFTIFNEDYDFYNSEVTDEVDFEYEEGEVYLRIYTFSENTYNKVVEGLDKVEDSDQKALVIDLRGNGGGLTQSANDILDCLLPECVTCTLIDRNGYTYSYFSDASQIEFNKIFILVDDYTASASELLTLGLDTYLNNVKILGRDTFGKGVGQTVLEDSKRKLSLFLVDHYWNVKQQNIMNTSIKPDVYITSDDLDDYRKVINESK